MKVEQYGVITEFANNHPILEENILIYYRYWDERLDMHDIDLNDFLQVCCLLKCCSQKEDDDILFTVHHIYRTLRFESILPVIILFDKIFQHKDLRGDKNRKEIHDEMFNLYREAFGIRHVWAITTLVNELANWQSYKIDLSGVMPV